MNSHDSSPPPPLRWPQDLALLLLVNGAGLAAAWSQSADRVRVDEAREVWSMPSDTVIAISDVVVWCGFPVAAIVFVVALFRRRWALAALTFLTGGAWVWLTIALGFFGGTSQIGDARATASDGRTYAVLLTGFQDYLYWLGRVESGPGEALRVRALARTDDFAAPTVRLVRPVGAPTKAGGLRTSQDGRYVVLEIWDGCGSLILDTATSRIWGPGPDGVEDADAATLPIVDASPFLLLGADDTPDPDDIARLRSADPGRCRGSKSLDQLGAAAHEHPNLIIRALLANP